MNKLMSGLLKIISQNAGKGQKRFLLSLLRAPTFEDAAKNRVASLQNAFILGLFIASVIDLAIILFSWNNQAFAGIGINAFAIILLTFAFFLMHRGHVETVSWILVTTVFIGFVFSVSIYNFDIPGALILAILITIAGLLLRSSGVIITSIVSLLTLTLFLYFQPLSQLTQGALAVIMLGLIVESSLLTIASRTFEQSLAEVDRSKQNALQVNKDLQDLTTQMTVRTETLVTEAENRKLAEQTILRQNQLLTAAAEIASAATSTLDLNKLMATSVELLREKFGFYQVSLFLIEPDSNLAVVLAASGEAGHQLKIGEHQLVVGSKSLVGMATATRRPVVVMDVMNHPTHFKNPLLPDTQSEAVIPLLIVILS